MSNNLAILDCTLRDGGYVNSFEFGEKSIKRIVRNLTHCGIDIVECGFLMNKPYDSNKTIFNSVSLISNFIPEERKNNTLYVGMIALGDIPLEMIEERKEGGIDGIRITFHKPQIDEAMKFIKEIKKKGYLVFVQPVGTTSYSDEELIDLINKANKIEPYAFYLVDTLGVIYKNDILNMFKIADKHLNKDIQIGYHSHNNLQLAFSNAQALADLDTERNIILDASVFGMGRGAGNLCTELITDYINRMGKKYYNIVPILDLLDNEIPQNYAKTPWGYNTSYYLSSTHRCHPNYSSYLLNKQMITARDINNILNSIPEEERDLFNKDLIEQLYIRYQENSIDDGNTIDVLSKTISNKSVLILGAGPSISNNKKTINSFIEKEKPFVVSINFAGIGLGYKPDMVFCSNTKRYSEVDSDQLDKYNIVVTSNVIKEITNDKVLPVNLSSLLVANQYVYDNAGLMFIKLLIKLNVKDIYLAGYDGFKNEDQDYIKSQLLFNPDRKEITDLKNVNMKNEIHSFRSQANISFITPSLYE